MQIDLKIVFFFSTLTNVIVEKILSFITCEKCHSAFYVLQSSGPKPLEVGKNVKQNCFRASAEDCQTNRSLGIIVSELRLQRIYNEKKHRMIITLSLPRDSKMKLFVEGINIK